MFFYRRLIFRLYFKFIMNKLLINEHSLAQRKLTYMYPYKYKKKVKKLKKLKKNKTK